MRCGSAAQSTSSEQHHTLPSLPVVLPAQCEIISKSASVSALGSSRTAAQSCLARKHPSVDNRALGVRIGNLARSGASSREIISQRLPDAVPILRKHGRDNDALPVVLSLSA